MQFSRPQATPQTASSKRIASKTRRVLVGGLLTALMLGLWGGGSAQAKSLGALEREVGRLNDLLAHYMEVLQMPKATSSRSIMKRFLDGLVLYEMKDYDKASVVFLDVVTNHKNSVPARQARFYLADCFYRKREYRSAVLHYQKVVDRGPSAKNYQRSLQRLLELSFRTGDHHRVHKLVSRIQQIAPGQRDDSMEYVFGKYYYFRGLMDRAGKVFSTIPLSSKHGNQARYFLGVINIKKNKLKVARQIFEQGLRRIEANQPKGKPFKGKARQVRDLYIMALARMCYHTDDPDGAIKYYKKVSRRSDQFEQALYELAWAYLKAWEFYRAIKSLELLVLVNPESGYLAESRILVGNLKILARQYGEARKLFKQTAKTFRPIYQKLRRLHKEHWSPKKFIALLTGEGTEGLDTSISIPRHTMKVLKRQPQVRKAIRVIDDIKSIRSAVAQCQRMITRVERRLGKRGKISAFPNLARARAHAVEVETKLTKLHAQISNKLQGSVRSALTSQERAQMNRMEARRKKFQKTIEEMPTTSEGFERRVAKIRKLYDTREKKLHKVSIAIQGLQARLTAIRSYYMSTKAQQKLGAQVVKQKVAALDKEISTLQKEADAMRAAITDGRSSAGVDDATMRQEQRIRNDYKALIAKQKRIMDNAKARMGAGSQNAVNRVEAVLRKANAVKAKLKTYDERINKLLAFKLGRTRRTLAKEKANLKEYRALLNSYGPEGQSVAGGVTQKNFKAISKDLYDLLVKADVGILDVAWAIKTAQSSKWADFNREQGKKLQALEKRFEEVRRR